MIDIQSSTSATMACSKEFLDMEHVPDLSKEEIGAIEEAGPKLSEEFDASYIQWLGSSRFKARTSLSLDSTTNGIREYAINFQFEI